MKKLNKILSVGLSLVMCAGMVVPSFAASFADLQNAIDGTGGTENGRTGYGSQMEDGRYEIEAWTENETRNIWLNNTVTQGDGKSAIVITNDAKGDVKKFNLDLNGKDIVGNGTSSVVRISGNVDVTVDGADETGSKGAITGGKGNAGGGVDVEGLKRHIDDPTVTLKNLEITGNTANNGAGVYVSDAKNVTLDNVNVSGNTANMAGGGVYVIQTNPRYSEDDTSLTVKNSTISNNTAANEGGGIFANSGVDVEISGSTIADNTATTGGGIFAIQTTNVHPGKQTTLTVDNSTISGNTVTGDGGGIFTNNAKTDIKNSAITKNEASYSGGGLYAMNSTASLNGVTVTGNKTTSGGFGGGLYAWNSTVNLNDGTVSNNETIWDGGGLYAENSMANLNGVTVTGNKAPEGNGGGLYAVDSTANLNSVTVTGNEAAWSGGGLYINQGTVKADDSSVIANNKAKRSADDVYGAKGSIVCLPAAGSMNQILTEDSKPITGWYYDANGGWATGKYPYSLQDHVVVGTTEALKGNLNIKAAHGQYFNVIYKDGVGENDGAELQKSEVENGSKIPGYDETPTREGYDFIGWRLADSSEVDFEAGVVSGELVFVAQWEEAESEPTGSPEPTDPGIDIEEPDIPMGEEPEVEIEDPDVPLAGLFTRADAIGYLWEQTGSPDAELSDFPDVPEDHYWAVAIGWAQDMGIALPDEEGNFRPDDLVLRSSNEPEGELQEFLNRYAVFAGAAEQGETFYVVAGVSDDIVMGEDAQVIFDEFFAKLEAALAKQAA